MGKLLIDPWQVETHPLLIYHLSVSLKGFLLCLQLIFQSPNLRYRLTAKVYHHLGSWIHALWVHHCPIQFRVLEREESILVLLHILKATTIETHAGCSACIFYDIFHGGIVSVLRIVRVQLICILLFVPNGDAYPGLPIGVL